MNKIILLFFAVALNVPMVAQECIVFEKEEVGDFSVLTISNKSYMLFIE